MGRFVYRAMLKEEKRLAAGWTYEPATIFEKNPELIALEKSAGSISFTQEDVARWIKPNPWPEVVNR